MFSREMVSSCCTEITMVWTRTGITAPFFWVYWTVTWGTQGQRGENNTVAVKCITGIHQMSRRLFQKQNCSKMSVLTLEGSLLTLMPGYEKWSLLPHCIFAMLKAKKKKKRIEKTQLNMDNLILYEIIQNTSFRQDFLQSSQASEMYVLIAPWKCQPEPLNTNKSFGCPVTSPTSTHPLVLKG